MTGFRVGPVLAARFIERPNRFVVRCRVPRRGVVTAFLPNPGRLWELLFPGATLYLTDDGAAGEGGTRRTRYTAVAVERDGMPVFLHTHLNNALARHLIEAGWLDALKSAELVRAEVSPAAHGPGPRSRFDFLLRENGAEVYLEVKSCTLFGGEVAMFPDAVTERGRRHLLELARLAEGGTRCAVLFLVHAPHVRWFMPDYHTDLAFSRTLLDVRRRVRILAAAVGFRVEGDGLRLAGAPRTVPIPWAYVDREARDAGSYLLILELRRRARIAVGGLGDLAFDPGYYVYVGSATRNLAARVARHVRVRKTCRWHIDYLRRHAAGCVPVPIRSSRRDEGALVDALADVFEPGPAGFGASDSTRPTHLLKSRENPLDLPAFHAALQRFRMRPPDIAAES
ncbi:MAG: DNA/RNA nuclease SfsA [Candidatus Hydrogenedentes bacterium]|nr:DNA/RNA nuclease SfsA [Candidatus Hydrogenedentota bacterium]